MLNMDAPTTPKQIPPVRAVMHGQAVSRPQGGIASQLAVIVERMRGTLGGMLTLDKAEFDELTDCADELEGLVKQYAGDNTPVMHRWRCRLCGKTILEYSGVQSGAIYKYCEHCRNPKVLNVLLDGVAQE